jgi:hypothetical protein
MNFSGIFLSHFIKNFCPQIERADYEDIKIQGYAFKNEGGVTPGNC